MNDNLMSPKRQVDQGAAAGAVLGAECSCMACQRSRCEASSVSTWDVWQEVLKQRALMMVGEERAARAVARSERARVQEAKQELTGSCGQTRDVDAMIRNLPNPDAPKSAAAQSQAFDPSTRLGCGYRLVGETETQRYYKAEVQFQPEPPPASEMDLALRAVSDANKELDNAVLALERRLGRVMRPEPEGKAPNACPVMASLPMEIRAGAACTQDSVDRLVSILARLVL